MSFFRNGVGYNSEDEANLADEIPVVYLDRPFDAAFIAEAILDSEWLAEHDRGVLMRAADVMDADPEFRDPLRLKSDWVREYAKRLSASSGDS